MRTATLGQTSTVIKSFAALIVLCLICPCISAAELQPMSETELKSIALNDFLRPVDLMIIETEEVISHERVDAGKLSITRAEAPIIIDAERLIQDLMVQYENLENGKGSIENFYPMLHDPSYLIKQ
jgi:hypothetical protein